MLRILTAPAFLGCSCCEFPGVEYAVGEVVVSVSGESVAECFFAACVPGCGEDAGCSFAGVEEEPDFVEEDG
jgi:hypothetical protein